MGRDDGRGERADEDYGAEVEEAKLELRRRERKSVVFDEEEGEGIERTNDN